ncbi:hypothetical protein BKA69DRAFT_1179108 [Paraphysoderma sedebokerense]|nr:hypothetical protein BKA69DRAFT_1179108 [Paraphysoderma sedebokerense]
MTTISSQFHRNQSELFAADGPNPPQIHTTFLDRDTVVFRIIEIPTAREKPYQVQLVEVPYAERLIQHVIEAQRNVIDWDPPTRTASAANLKHLKTFVMAVAFQLDKCRMQNNGHAGVHYFTHFDNYIAFVGGGGLISFPQVRRDIIDVDRLHASDKTFLTGEWDSTQVPAFDSTRLNFIPHLTAENVDSNFRNALTRMFSEKGLGDRVTVDFGKYLVSAIQGDLQAINTCTEASRLILNGKGRVIKTDFTPCLPMFYFDHLTDRLSNDSKHKWSELEERTDVIISIYFPRIFQPNVEYPNHEQQNGRIKLKCRDIKAKGTPTFNLCRDTERKFAIAYASGNLDTWDFKINMVGPEKKFYSDNSENREVVEKVKEYFRGREDVTESFHLIDQDRKIWGHVGRIDVYHHRIFKCEERGIAVDIVWKYCRRVFKGPDMCGITIEVLNNEAGKRMTADSLIENILHLMNLVNLNE